MKKYLNNPKFINWVYNPNKESNTYMKLYLLKHPEEEVLVNELKDILIGIKQESAISIPDCKEEVFEAIMARISEQSKNKKKGPNISRLYNYAAVFFIAIGLGSFLFLNSRAHFSHAINTETVQMDTVSSTQLILGNKKAVVINTKESQVEYKTDGNIIVNNKEAVKSGQQNEELNQLLVPYGKRSRIVLDDNTIVHLNAGSKFIFPSSFSGKKDRTVFLEGEAYFEVATNKAKPFIVKTLNDDYEIKVLGTKFNVAAYASEKFIQTVLKEGSVKILNKEKLFFTKEKLLKPGELALWNSKNNEILVYNVNPNHYSAWTKGYLPFNREPLKKIVKKLMRYYNVSIKFQDDQYSEKKVSGKLDLNDDIDTTLKNLALTYNLKMNKNSKNEYIIE